MRSRALASPLLAVALAVTAIVAAGCASSSSAAPGTPPPGTPSTVTPSSSAPSTAVPTPSAPSSSAPSKPSAADMATDRLADAVLEQLKIDSPDTFTDQLITIALSPLMRQLAATADVSTRVGSKGPRVTLTLTGDDGSCVITVTDEPRARGVVCRR